MLPFQGFRTARLGNLATSPLGTAEVAHTPSRGPLPGREVRLRSFEQAAEHPDAIDQETAIGGIVTPALTNTAIHPQAVPAGQAVLLR